MTDLNGISGAIVDSAIKVHSVMGPGLLENAYEACLAEELTCRGHRVATQVPIPLQYGSVRLDVGFRMDMLVDHAVVVELKATSRITEVHEAQLLSHLRLGGFKLGLLINFHVVLLRDGIWRKVNKL